MRRLALALVVLTACGSSSPAPPVAGPALSIVAAGMSATPSGSSVGVSIRNPAGFDAVGIELSLAFVDRSGAAIGRATERLAYCPARLDCLWGSTFTSDVVPASAADVRVAASVAAWEPPSRRAPFVLVRRRPDGMIAGQAPPGGTVYVVSLVGGEPRAGVFRRTGEAPDFVVPADLVPPASGEVVRAVFYAEAMPAGD